MRIKDISKWERPRERFRMKGADVLSDAELLAIILQKGTTIPIKNRNIYIRHITIMLHMLQKSSMFKILEVFFVSPTEKKYLMDISRRIGLAHTSVKKNLDKLMKLELITGSVEKKGKRKFPFYRANTDSKLFKKEKMVYNLSSVLNSGMIEFIEEILMPKSIVLFGSYQRGEDTESSDVDLFVECKEKSLDLRKFEKKLDRKVQLHFKENFGSYPNELKNNIINGTVLMGFLEGYK